jgi:hypothetical protein
LRVRALLAVALALRVATHGGGDRVVITQDVLTRSTLCAEEKSLVGIAIGDVVSLGLTGLAASVLEGTAPVRLSTHLVVGGIWMGVAACAC